MEKKKNMKTTKDTEDPLVKAIEYLATKAFISDGNNPPSESKKHLLEFNTLISGTNTFHVVRALTILIKPGRVPAGLRPHLMEALTRLPQRPDGVRAILEFVFSVHPSNTVKMSEAANPQKQGANITMESLKMASNLLSVPPANVDPEEWFQKIAPQLLALLDGKDGPDLVKVSAYVIGFGILGRRKFGSPRQCGWNNFARPILEKINPSMDAHLQENPLEPARPMRSATDEDPSISVVRGSIIVEPDELALALGRLRALLNSHPNPGLTTRLLHQIMPQLWALSSWPGQDEDISNRYSRPAKTLLETTLKLSKDVEQLRRLIDNLLYKGESNESAFKWKYERSAEGGINVRWVRSADHPEHYELNVEELEFKVNAFVQLLQSLNSDPEISALFLSLLKDSLVRKEGRREIKIRADEEEATDPTTTLVQAKVLQSMMEVMPNRLVSDPKQLLDLVSDILRGYDVTSQGDESTPIALSLLNLVVTAPEFKKSDIDSTILTLIELSLNTISEAQDPDVSQTAHNISLLLTYRDAVDDPSEKLSAPTDRQVEDRRTYNLAMQYITEPNSPPPVRSEGLNLLSSLIQANSPILDIPTVLALLSSLLSDDEDYTNLRVIRLFAQLAARHPKSTTREILERYVDASEKSGTDARLRFGEALLQVIQRLGEAFAGDTAALVAENLLATAGRRGRRPRTLRRQEREARARARRHREASDAWGGEVPDLGDSDGDGDSDDERTEEERARDEAIAQIVGGWESRRGREDMRVRASALSIFAAALETNAAGLGGGGGGPRLVEAAVDLCVGALTLERGAEAGILRRGAVAVILSFVRALAAARESGRPLGFGLADASRGDIARVLRYVAQTDNDGLVQHNAREVAESLENWALTTLVPPEARGAGPAATLTRLAGLNVGAPSLPPLRQEGSGPGAKVRPRIEEIE